MKEVILVKNGELALKGLNRSSFEDILIKNIKKHLENIGKFDFTKSQSTIMIEPLDKDTDLDDVESKLKKVFGIAAFSRCAVCEKDMAEIRRVCVEYLTDELASAKTFKVEAKRSDKRFVLKSPEICRDLGGVILRRFHNLKVDVHNPDIIVTVEIRDKFAFIHGNSIRGAGGMPSRTSGRGAVLISGGIDSPVAAWMMAKRGMELVGVHFASPPYTSELAKMKVFDLLEKVAEYSGQIKTFVVPFTEIQLAIRDLCPTEYFTLVMRRVMMKISTVIAKQQNCQAVITGESVGQVASQTVYALQATDCATDMPVFRPCIGMDKQDIIKISRDIGTYDISIEPYEDCCTVFTPKHPRTKPKVEAVVAAENKIENLDELIAKAVKGAEIKFIR